MPELYEYDASLRGAISKSRRIYGSMRRWETLTALAAVISASIAALPIAGRLWFALIAIALIAVVGGAQLHRSLTKGQEPASGLSAQERARRIREQRNRR